MTDDPVEEFEERFTELREDLGFQASLEELDPIFFFRDMAAGDGVMPRLDRQVCRRIVDTFFSWNNFLHRLIMPNPHSMFETAEAGHFTEQDHEEMFAVMHRILAHCTRNNVMGVSRTDQEQGAFIDDSLSLWHELQPYFVSVSQKVQQRWQEKADED